MRSSARTKATASKVLAMSAPAFSACRPGSSSGLLPSVPRSFPNATSDPENELNLLYLRGRAGLEDRVFRLEAGDSFASVPLDRTVHVVGNAIVIDESNGELVVAASWLCHVYGIRGSFTRGGRYDYRLRHTDRGLRIASKKITMIDDKLEGPVDIYHV